MRKDGKELARESLLLYKGAQYETRIQCSRRVTIQSPRQPPAVCQRRTDHTYPSSQCRSLNVALDGQEYAREDAQERCALGRREGLAARLVVVDLPEGKAAVDDAAAGRAGDDVDPLDGAAVLAGRAGGVGRCEGVGGDAAAAWREEMSMSKDEGSMRMDTYSSRGSS